MHLRLITPERQVVDAEVSEITAPGSAGEFGVLPLHVTFVGELAIGVLSYVEGGSPERVLVHGGYAEVVDDVVTVLADDAELPEEINAAGAREDLRRVESALAEAKDDPAEIARLLTEQRRAELRIALAT